MPKIHCDCGKMLARWDNGTLYLWCKSCKKEIAIRIPENRATVTLVPVSHSRKINATK